MKGKYEDIQGKYNKLLQEAEEKVKQLAAMKDQEALELTQKYRQLEEKYNQQLIEAGVIAESREELIKEVVELEHKQKEKAEKVVPAKEEPKQDLFKACTWLDGF